MVKLSFRWYRVVVMLVVIFVGAGTLRLESVQKASASDCVVEAFSVSPNSSSQAVGTILSLYGRGNCGGGIRASRFNIDGGGFGEDAGAPEQSETWQLTAGAHTICFEIAGGSNGDWSAGASSCITITGVSNPPPPPPPPTNPVNPSVSGPNINPSGTCRWDVFLFLTGFAPNSAITVTSSYSELVCSSGQQVSSSWSAYMGTTDSSGNFTFGIVHQGTGSYTYTFRDAQGNSRSSSFNTSNSNPPPPPPQPTVNPVQPTSQPTTPPVGSTPPTQTPRPPNDTSCSNAPTQRVSSGQQVQVTSTGAGLRLRQQPNTAARILRTIPAGRQLDITGGPQCGNGYRWWQVNYSGVTGWVADGSGSSHWIEPISATPVPQQPQQPTSSGCQPSSACIQFVTGSKDRPNNRWWPDRVYQDSAENRQCSADDLDTIIEFDLDYGAWASYNINSFRLYAVYLTRPINEFFNSDRQARVSHQSDSAPRLRICVPHQLNGHNFYVWSEDAP
ncbi:MAG: SH3 domain-containing protein [Anaerolineae bacterium]|nr:SH3 domain-containing protein [Anaerolineae bacterium]